MPAQRYIRTWKQARKKLQYRTSPCGIYSGPIDRGVNFFVLMLEQLHAKPHYSCEGHPQGFYVLFEASLYIALQIRKCGYFKVELEGGDANSDRHLWSIRIGCEPETEQDRQQILTWAARSWFRHLGPIGSETINRHADAKKLQFSAARSAMV